MPSGDPYGWAGVGISYAINGYYSNNWCCSPNWSSGFPLVGASGVSAFNGWLYGGANGLSVINRTADTVLIAEKASGDTTYWAGNPSGFSPNCVFGGDQTNGIGWGDSLIPDGTRNPTAAYPNGPNGAVSAHHAGKTNVLFCDGHVKTMTAAATDPDPKNRPQEHVGWLPPVSAPRGEEE